MKIREKKDAQGKMQKNKYSLRTRLRGWFHHGRFIGFDIQSIIMAVLTGLTITTTVVMGFLIYNRFKLAIKQTAVSNAESMIESTVDKVDTDLAGIRQISNGVNYNIIQEYDISSQEFSKQFSLLYEVNVDKVQSMALYDNSGKLVAAEPVAVQKDKVNVEEQEWYKNASEDIENMHFSTPHIQDLFQDGANRYYWVISLSRSVDINDGDKPVNGVLLIDMKYSVIEEALSRINDSSSETYYYLCNRDGDIIYHPRRAEIDRGFFTEESAEAAVYDDGTYEIKMTGGKENVVVSSIAYTGWKIIGVVPESVQTASINQYRYYIITTVVILLMMLLWVNRIITKKISKPILKLNESVKSYETGGTTDIYIGGSSEIRHLGYSVKKSYEQIEILMQEIIRQQNERRKSEMDALQSQINPHFLYNTLEAIRMKAICNGDSEVGKMLYSMAVTFRSQLKEADIITLAQELHYCKKYLELFEYRYPSQFKSSVDCPFEYMQIPIIKFVLQPIIENYFIHGIRMRDKDNFICIRVEKTTDDYEIIIEDNGRGMSEKDIREKNRQLTENVMEKNKSIGISNVNRRVKAVYGNTYGVSLEQVETGGLRVILRFKPEEDNENEKSNDC